MPLWFYGGIGNFTEFRTPSHDPTPAREFCITMHCFIIISQKVIGVCELRPRQSIIYHHYDNFHINVNVFCCLCLVRSDFVILCAFKRNWN